MNKNRAYPQPEFELGAILIQNRWVGGRRMQWSKLPQMRHFIAAEETHYLRVYLAHLRHKLEADPANPRLLLTELGVGYRLAVDE